jgi:hypothetical protein
VAFTVTTTGNTDGGSRVEHRDADTVAVEDGHLVLRAHRAIVGIYAPGRWHSVVEERQTPGPGRRIAFHEVPA